MNATGIRPQSSRILIEPNRADEKTEGGLFLPTEVQTKDGHAQTKGRIVELGPEAFDDYGGEAPKAGDMVYFNRYAGANTTIKGNDDLDYWIIQDGDILATIEE